MFAALSELEDPSLGSKAIIYHTHHAIGRQMAVYEAVYMFPARSTFAESW